MGKLGFYCFTEPAPVVVPTLRQQVTALSDDQRQALIVNFRQLIPAAHSATKLGISKEICEYVYDGIDAIQERCRAYMRGEVIVTPGEPPVYNTRPTTQVQLNTTVRPDFIADYPQLFITNVVQEMIDWCKYDGTGTFLFYKNNIIL